ncbi:unnamed protein product [Ceutorhynchus assimilis]|uniref:Large proline-rich protein BAG6 n=1 Tax=Ceutorhynchus assimilis TaxID=467358 RepID=A0A9N9MS40_9CUCU|nr:unnamed protein product [Ceutorhynchus assimilis]
MINITVKTLDSQNHQFTVDENITVEEFKSHIAERVDVPAVRQRIIYCGRVLQDTSKLSEYDVNDKVVHLVQRLPPSSTPRTGRSLTPPPDFNRAAGGGFPRARGSRPFTYEVIDQHIGNVYMGMGSMSFPSMDPHQMIPPRATHTLSASRLNVARRMLRHAGNVIRQLENADGGGSDDTVSPEEPTEEEMTPVIEARVIVPVTGDQQLLPLDSNAIISAVQNSIFPPEGTTSMTLNTDSASSSSATPDSTTPQPATVSNSEGEAISSAISFIHNLSRNAEDQPSDNAGNADNSNNTPSVGQSTPSDNSNNLPRNGQGQRERVRQPRTCRGEEMATLLNTLNQLQLRFAPYLARYQAFMQEDPHVASDSVQDIRHLLNRVSQVLHFLGHAYHSLSDIIIDVEHPPPRLLLCRPILIQPPTVVQGGIPIQVEAQINLLPDRPPATTNSTPTTPTTTSPDTVTGTPPTSTTNDVRPNNGGPSINVVPVSVAIIEEHVRLGPQLGRARRTNGPPGGPRPPAHSSFIGTSEPSTTASAPSGSTPSTEKTQPDQQNNSSQEQSNRQPAEPETPTSRQPEQTSGQLGNSNLGSPNGNLEFFMEVTPEALRGGNLIQSLMQLVGSQLGDTITQLQADNRPNGPAQPNQQQVGSAQSQQSQARSTQTNPTTSTHTRSTPRPHVHMTQQAVQGGFDPFLHCYSHHVTQARPQRLVTFGGQQPSRTQSPLFARQHLNVGSTTNQPNNNSNPQASRPEEVPIEVANRFEELIRRNLPNIAEMVAPNIAEMVNAARMSVNVQGAPAGNDRPAQDNIPHPARGTPDGQNQPPPNITNLFASLMEQSLPDILSGRGPTMEVMVQSIHPETIVQGENLVIDLMMLVMRNLRLNDLFTLSSGNMTPLQSQIETIQGFFLTAVCQNDTTDAGVARAAVRLIGDLNPIITALESIPARENINMSRTIDGFFSQRVPDIIRMAVNSGSRGEGSNGQNFVTTVWRAIRELFALAIHCSSEGQRGVEDVFEQIVVSTMTPSAHRDVFQFTIHNTRSALGTILQNLDIGTADIERFIVQNVIPAPPPPPVTAQDVTPVAAQPISTEQMQEEAAFFPVCDEVMEVEEYDMDVSPPNEENVVVNWGSEPWHIVTPQEWAPIITADGPRQKKQNSQPPFSDAYLSGMPSKRRKLINNAKPQGSLPQVISESIQQAVTSSGLASAAPLAEVAEAASESVEIQAAFRSLLQTTVQTNLRNNEDFDPEKYPNAANYFMGSSPE